MRITGVPLHESDLVRQSCTHGFTITEAWSPPRKIPAHAHAMLSITMLLHGDFEERYQSNFRPNTCVKGSLLIRPAGEIHENSLGNKGGRTLSIELDPAHFEKYGSSIAGLQSLTLLRESAFLDIGVAMSCELRHTDQAAALALESLGLELLARLIRVREFRAAAGSAPPWLGRARDSIADRCCESSLRLADLAAEAGVHPVYLARAFRRAYSVSPGEYLRRIRVERARQRVVNSHDSLACIAMDCGFSDQSHFARAFRKRFGVTPAYLRRQNSIR